MSILTFFALCAGIIATSFLSGIFGMAGGMILIGILFLIMPLPAAMILHAVTQISANGWRGLLWRRHVRWQAIVAYAAGGLAAFGAWSLVRVVPSKPLALVILGAFPLLARLLPGRLKPDPDSVSQGIVYGIACLSMIRLTGVTGPLLDSFFIGGRFTRHEIVATKSACQVFGHAIKLLYFGGIIDGAALPSPSLAVLAIVCAIIGTTLARPILEAMSDSQYRIWTSRIITCVCGYYVVQGGYLFFTS